MFHVRRIYPAIRLPLRLSAQGDYIGQNKVQYEKFDFKVRTYLMPVRPFTLALRGLYYGRYGRSGDDERLPTL